MRKEGHKIETEFVYPPIPDRSMDWRATFEGFDEGDPMGVGPTELAAIADLLEQQEARDEKPKPVGVAANCTVCGKRKKPVGRSAPAELAVGMCDFGCPGYLEFPMPGSLWPGEEGEADG